MRAPRIQSTSGLNWFTSQNQLTLERALNFFLLLLQKMQGFTFPPAPSNNPLYCNGHRIFPFIKDRSFYPTHDPPLYSEQQRGML